MDSFPSKAGFAWTWPKRLGFMLAAALVAVIALSSGGTSAADNVHGAVYAWAEANPGQDVPVLVQTDGDTDTVADLIRSAGGSVERQFEIVPVVEADVSPALVATLAGQPGVAWVSLNAPVFAADGGDVTTAGTTGTTTTTTDSTTSTASTTGTTTTSDSTAPSSTSTVNAYPFAVGASGAWSQGFRGTGVTVAVVDTGISPSGHEDFKGADGYSRVRFEVEVSPNTSNLTDGYGHGTHIAGIVGGNGRLLNGKYVGIAPNVNLLNVKVADDQGGATLADVIAGMEFVYHSKSFFNTRVVNLSLTSSVAQSYRTDPLCAAAEFLWFNGIFVVAASGNLGSAADAVHYCPGSDPFVMTVGAFDDFGTADFSDDAVTSWSSRGTTQDGFYKPELVAPGRNIVSVIDTNSILYKTYPERIVDDKYFRLSGTSMATGVVSGVAALALERHPQLTPGQLKDVLLRSTRSISGSGGKAPLAGQATAFSGTPGNTDAGLTPSFFLFRAPVVTPVGVIAYVLGSSNSSGVATEIGLDMDAAGIRGSSLNSVDWGAIKWSAIKWSAIKWGLIKWDAIKWDAIKWDAIKWSDVTFDGIDWSAIKWSAIKWSAIKWDAIKWSAIKWSAIKWSAIKWDAIKWSASTVEFDAIKWSAIKWGAFTEQ